MSKESSEFIARMAETFRPDGTQDESEMMRVMADMGVAFWEEGFAKYTSGSPADNRAAAEDLVLSARSYLAGNDT